MSQNTTTTTAASRSSSDSAASSDQEIQSLHIQKEAFIDASLEIVWESLLAEIGPESQMPDGKPMPFVLEAWPGGRWYRDLGNNAGHFWGNVQVIKPPTLLEISGPMFMSYAAANHLQYRLAAEGSGTKLTLTHRGFGQIPDEHRKGVNSGWQSKLDRIKQIALQRKAKH